ncbi:MAG TPA: YihY/virulence factor BrkB family protein [Polyangiaceae bacterium]|nr:YihY/virulence factor BrkB family protein [Polyangiaceae bacterium]
MSRASVPAGMKSVYEICRRVSERAAEHDVDMAAAGLSFYALLGLFPSLLAIVSIYGLVANPASAEAVLTSLARTLPPQARELVLSGLAEFVKRSSGDLTLRIVFGFGAVLWSSSSGMSVLVRAINVAYEVKEHRNFFARRAIALLFTLGGVVGVAVVVPALTAVPRLLHLFRADTLLVFVPPLALAVTAFLALLVLFRYAPYRQPSSFAEVAPGAALASIAWLVVSGAYSLYVRFLARFGSTYGALEGVVVLELWFYFSAQVLLYAAELNVVLGRRQSAPARGDRPVTALG